MCLTPMQSSAIVTPTMKVRLSPEMKAAFQQCGSEGGKARARKLSKKRREAIARKAALARWGKR
jgi:hypothetical protein